MPTRSQSKSRRGRILNKPRKSSTPASAVLSLAKPRYQLQQQQHQTDLGMRKESSGKEIHITYQIGGTGASYETQMRAEDITLGNFIERVFIQPGKFRRVQC